MFSTSLIRALKATLPAGPTAVRAGGRGTPLAGYERLAHLAVCIPASFTVGRVCCKTARSTRRVLAGILHWVDLVPISRLKPQRPGIRPAAPDRERA